MFSNVIYGIILGLELKLEHYFSCKSDVDFCGKCDLATLKTYLVARGFDKTAPNNN